MSAAARRLAAPPPPDPADARLRELIAAEEAADRAREAARAEATAARAAFEKLQSSQQADVAEAEARFAESPTDERAEQLAIVQRRAALRIDHERQSRLRPAERALQEHEAALIAAQREAAVERASPARLRAQLTRLADEAEPHVRALLALMDRRAEIERDARVDADMAGRAERVSTEERARRMSDASFTCGSVIRGALKDRLSWTTLRSLAQFIGGAD